MRVDVALNRLCLTRSRNEAKVACDAGAVSVSGNRVKANASVAVGDVVQIRFSNRTLEIRLLDLPAKSVSKRAAREMYEVISESAVQHDD